MPLPAVLDGCSQQKLLPGVETRKGVVLVRLRHPQAFQTRAAQATLDESTMKSLPSARSESICCTVLGSGGVGSAKKNFFSLGMCYE